MKLELTMDDNTLTAIKDLTDNVITKKKKVILTIDFIIQAQKRMDNSQLFTAIPTKIKVSIA
jgi:hypothetical protein